MTDFSAITNNLNKVADTVKRQAMAVIEVEAVKSVQKNFEVGGRPGWIPSKKSGKLKNTKTLVVSGALSRVSAVANLAGGTVTLIASPESRAYAKIQNEGGVIQVQPRTVRHRKVTAGKNKGKTVFASKKNKKVTETTTKAYTIKIPARPFMVIPPEEAQAMMEKVKSAVKL